MGSGTTCVAARRLNRHFVGYDISANYYEIARRRIDSTPVESKLDDSIGV